MAFKLRWTQFSIYFSILVPLFSKHLWVVMSWHSTFSHAICYVTHLSSLLTGVSFFKKNSFHCSECLLQKVSLQISFLLWTLTHNCVFTFHFSKSWASPSILDLFPAWSRFNYLLPLPPPSPFIIWSELHFPLTFIISHLTLSFLEFTAVP